MHTMTCSHERVTKISVGKCWYCGIQQQCEDCTKSDKQLPEMPKSNW